jgi:hypothetical protein
VVGTLGFSLGRRGKTNRVSCQTGLPGGQGCQADRVARRTGLLAGKVASRAWVRRGKISGTFSFSTSPGCDPEWCLPWPVLPTNLGISAVPFAARRSRSRPIRSGPRSVATIATLPFPCRRRASPPSSASERGGGVGRFEPGPDPRLPRLPRIPRIPRILRLP